MRKINIMLMKALTAVGMLTAGITIQAQTYLESRKMEVFTPSCDNNQFDIVTKGNTKMYTRKVRLNAPCKEEAGEVTITFKLEYDAELYSFQPGMNKIRMFSDDEEGYINSPFMYGGEPYTVTVPTGTYDITATFNHAELGQPTIYIVKELVEILKDTTITMNPAEATNHIHVNNYAPDGTIFKKGLGYWDESGEWVHTEDGNICDYCIINELSHKDWGQLMSHSFTVAGWDEDKEEKRTESQYDIDINDVSNRYSFTQIRMTLSLDGNDWYFNHVCTDNFKVGVLENDISNYTTFQESWKYSPYSRDIEAYGFSFSYYDYFKNLWAGTTTSGGSLVVQGDKKKGDICTYTFHVNAPNEEPCLNDRKYLFDIGFFEYTDTVIQWGWKTPKYKFANTIPFRIVDGKREFVNLGHPWDDSGTNNGMFDIENKDNPYFISALPQLEPIHPAFTYEPSRKLGILGNNCPINAFMTKNYTVPWQQDAISEMTSYYIGRYGEIRWIDIPLVTETLKFNGEEVEDIDAWIPDGLGVYDRTYVNTNVEVDELAGKNVTTVHYDMNQEDSTPPSIQMLQFKNNEDGITDRFSTADEGTMEFTAGDFNYIYNSEKYYGLFDCQPITISVEYAPYGEDTWTEMEVEEIPELFQMPGWGYFYRASLEKVTGQAEKGWFDLRFKLADEAGNWQEQVISPAFCILDRVDTGIDDNNQYTITNKLDATAVYDLIGRKVGNGKTSKGVYIVNGRKVIR